MAAFLLELKDKADAAQKDYEAAFRRQYPEGTPIMWERGGNRCYGVVMSHAYGERMKVYNYGTRKEYFIYFSDALRAM